MRAGVTSWTATTFPPNNTSSDGPAGTGLFGRRVEASQGAGGAEARERKDKPERFATGALNVFGSGEWSRRQTTRVEAFDR